MAAKFLAATRSIPCHRSSENLGVNVVVKKIHADCSPSIRCQRTPLLPKRTRLTHICFQPRKCRTRTYRENRSRYVPRHCPSVWPKGQSLLSSWLDCPGANQDANEAGLPCPAESSYGMHDDVRLCLRKDHRPRFPEASASSAHRLSTCSPLLHARV